MAEELTWHDARNAASTAWQQLKTEKVAISLAVGRTLAADAKALVELPTYPTSAMDGYAVAGTGPWEIVGEVKAGAPMKGVLKEKTAVKIATGAVIPDKTFGIIRWEDASVDGSTLTGEVKEGQDIRPAGLESKKGEVIAEKGAELNPGLIGLLAAAGYDEVEVTVRPRATIILLGDEIQLEGLPSDGFVRDALGPQLPGWLARMGVEVIALNYISDEFDLVIKAFKDAFDKGDLVITTGGTADGPRDHVRAAIAELKGEMVVDRVKVRPGHPMILGKVNKKPLLALPGNPQSAIVALMTLGQPTIDALLGRTLRDLNIVVTGDDIDAPEGFTRLVLGNMIDGWFEMGEYLGSAMLRGLAHSSGFAVAKSNLAEGEMAEWLPLP
jgi:molybdopterin molybdotransferase